MRRAKDRRPLWLAFMALCLVVSGYASAQTTGRIEGRVLEPSGSPLPGVTVTVTSPKLQGERLQFTNSDGVFRFASLPPGSYLVRATLDGFNNLEQTGVLVGIDRTASLEMQMSAAVTDVITVTTEGPAIDVTDSSAGINLTGEVFDKLPLARDFYDVAKIAAGSGEDREGTTFSGATSVENQYIIEGLNATGVELGQQNKRLNNEFIQEVQVITGGLPAEYGRISGGVIKAITKSGGNDFSGDVFGYFEDEDLKSDNSTAQELRDDAFQVVETAEQQDLGFDLGGFIVKDKLWFFTAFNRVEETERKTLIRDIPVPGAPQNGDVIDSDIERDLFAGKLTWAVTQSHTLTGSIFGDPSTKDGSILLAREQITGPPSTFLGTRDRGGTNYTLRWDGIFAGSAVVEALYGAHREEDKVDGPGKSIVHVIDQTLPGSPTSGGFDFHQDQEFDRDVFKVDASFFLGDHDIKVGGDVEDLAAVNANWNGGAGQRIYIRPRDNPDDPQHYRHRFFVDTLAPGFDANDSSTWQLAVPLVSTPETTNTSLFAQDSWRISDHITANVGVRYERQEIGDRFGATQIDLDDNWAGRLGAVWDVGGNGKSKLSAHYGRYFLSIPMDINIRAFGGEVQCFCYNFSPDPADIQPDPNAPERSRLTGAGGTPVDQELGGQYVDDFILGYEQEVAPDLVVGISATYRDLGRIVEDFLIVDQGDYFIANPGESLGTEVTFYDYTTAPTDGAEREYIAVSLTARKRFSNNWQLLANYVWSELEGNYDGAFQVSTGQLDPTINSAFDYADFLINANGKLSLDREHQFRVDSSYVFDRGIFDGLTLGGSAYFRSGFPLNAYGYSSAYNNHELFLVPRGSLGRGPDEYEVDLHFGYPVNLGSSRELNLFLDVFNLLDRQEATRLDERFNRAEDGACASAGVPDDICSSMGGIANVPGTLDPAGSLDNPRATSPNPNFLNRAARSIDFTGQRTFRVGVRFSF